MKKSTSFKEAVEDKKVETTSFLYPISRDSSYIESKKWIGDSESPLIPFDSNFTFEDFLNYKGDGVITNWDRIETSYITKEEQEKYKRINPLIKRGVKVLLPTFLQKKVDLGFDSVNKSPVYKGTNILLGEQERELLNDPYFDKRLISSEDYIKEYLEEEKFSGPGTIRLRDFNTVATSLIKTKPFYIGLTCNVWVYSKVLQKIINISSKISSLKTVNKFKGSNFSCSLSGVEFTDKSQVSMNSFEPQSKNSLYEFTKIFSENDLVFLKFSEISKNLTEQVEIPFSELSGKFFDLIGLIDTVTEEIDYEKKEVSYTFSGRDFSKVFEDDEAKFFPVALTEDLNNRLILGSGELGGQNKLAKRTFSGDYYTMFTFIGGSVGEIFLWYLNLLSNLGVVSDKESSILFSSYGDRRKYKDEGRKKLQTGIYQIINLYVDERVKERRLVDKNIGSPDGNFIQLFDNLCISPFVEWYMDTYGDMFNIILRQPPFTKDLMVSYLNTLSPSYRVISNSFVSESSLEFESEFYTWYQLYPEGYFWGITNKTSMDFLPVLQLSEYIERWGSKPMSLQTNYIEIDTSIDDKSKQNLEDTHKRSIEDLLIMVESTCYLPFTRRGEIILSCIDRSFRKGTFCYFEKTGEVFYIDSVTHTGVIDSEQLDGSTILSVSRGMVFQYIKGVHVEGKLHSYFNIVDLDFIKDTLYMNYNLKKRVDIQGRGNKFVDSTVFDFFLKRKQFDK